MSNLKGESEEKKRKREGEKIPMGRTTGFL